MPLLIADNGFAIPESDTISRYLMSKFRDLPPSFEPTAVEHRCLSDLICRIHDIYITPVQAAMYRAPGSIFGSFGTDRKSAIAEIQRQLDIISSTIEKFDSSYPHLKSSTGYLCGPEISLADAALFPTAVFINFMLPEFFGIPTSTAFKSPLKRWWDFMVTKDAAAIDVKAEMELALNDWKAAKRWSPILEEIESWS